MFQIFHVFAHQNTKILCFSTYDIIYSWSEMLKTVVTVHFIAVVKIFLKHKYFSNYVLRNIFWIILGERLYVSMSVIITCLQSMDAEDVLSQQSDYVKYLNS